MLAGVSGKNRLIDKPRRKPDSPRNINGILKHPQPTVGYTSRKRCLFVCATYARQPLAELDD